MNRRELLKLAGAGVTGTAVYSEDAGGRPHHRSTELGAGDLSADAGGLARQPARAEGVDRARRSGSRCLGT